MTFEVRVSEALANEISLHLVDPVFGPLVFVGVLIAPGVVELAAFRQDPDYWALIEDDPND